MKTAGREAAQLANQLLAAWNSHDIDRIVSYYALDFVGEDVAQATVLCGHAGLRETIERYLRAFPDVQFEACETIVDGDHMAQRWTARGTHRGTLMNIPGTGRPFIIRGTTFLTLRDRKVARATLLWDVAGLLRSIGLLPDL